MTILVTGATGHVGGRIARLLSDRGVSIRRLARTPAKAPALPDAPVVEGDYGDRAALDRAMRGIDTVFLASGNVPPLKRAGLHGNVIDAAAHAGVRRLVYLSFQNASATSPFPYSADHLLTEAHPKQSRLACQQLPSIRIRTKSSIARTTVLSCRCHPRLEAPPRRRPQPGTGIDRSASGRLLRGGVDPGGSGGRAGSQTR